MHQAQAIPTRRSPPRPTLRTGSRVPLGAAAGLALLVLLAPQLSIAPVSPEARRAPPRGEPAAAAIVSDGSLDAFRFPAALDAARAVAGAEHATLAVVRDGRLVWAGGSGSATGARADSTMVIGSVSKTFIAATILQMVAGGRLDLDDTIGDLLPAHPAIPASATVRQLLDHTSGALDLFNNITDAALEQEPDHAWTTDELLDTVHAPVWHPGETWAYSNTNYYLLGLIIERLSGEELATELERRFFEPLGLADTRLLSLDDPAPLTAAWATVFWASGSVASSARDLARWGDGLYGGDVLPDDVRAAMLDFNIQGYGLGAQRIPIATADGVGHSGLIDRWTTLLWHIPDEDVTIALLVDTPHAPLGVMLTATPPGGGPSLLDLVTED
jgi:D-alanyl-D-alanine carboxypeptidase